MGLQREFSRQSFKFEILEQRQENGEVVVCGRVFCQACCNSRNRHKNRSGNVGIITTSNIRDILNAHCFPNPGCLKKLWTCLKHQEALRDWVVKQRTLETRIAPEINYIPSQTYEQLKKKYCKRGFKFNALQERTDSNGRPLVCALIRCEACIWLSGFVNDFGHEHGVISGENIMKSVKRHCKSKNVFHARAWQSWRTIQRLKVAQNTEYLKMLRRQ